MAEDARPEWAEGMTTEEIIENSEEICIYCQELKDHCICDDEEKKEEARKLQTMGPKETAELKRKILEDLREKNGDNQ